jgi:hypothetical protein
LRAKKSQNKKFDRLAFLITEAEKADSIQQLLRQANELHANQRFLLAIDKLPSPACGRRVGDEGDYLAVFYKFFPHPQPFSQMGEGSFRM